MTSTIRTIFYQGAGTVPVPCVVHQYATVEKGAKKRGGGGRVIPGPGEPRHALPCIEKGDALTSPEAHTKYGVRSTYYTAKKQPTYGVCTAYGVQSGNIPYSSPELRFSFSHKHISCTEYPTCVCLYVQPALRWDGLEELQF